MNWLQLAWIGVQAFCITGGIIAGEKHLIEIGVAGLVGVFVGWIDWHTDK